MAVGLEVLCLKWEANRKGGMVMMAKVQNWRDLGIKKWLRKRDSNPRPSG
jgi:hypothetical protein